MPVSIKAIVIFLLKYLFWFNFSRFKNCFVLSIKVETFVGFDKYSTEPSFDSSTILSCVQEIKKLLVQFSTFNFFWAFGKPPGFPLYLCSLHLLLAQKFIPKSHSQFPNSNSHHLAKDAASIPNAPLKTENSN